MTTVATRHRDLFGCMTPEGVALNELGRIVRATWDEIPAHRPYVRLDAYVVMPDHFHALFWIKEAWSGSAASATLAAGSVGAILGGFKAAAAKRINLWRGTPGGMVWARGYHDWILRVDLSVHRVRRYIDLNPIRRWVRQGR
ncbi:MAG: hypothetical protein WBC97_09105 [Gemmatimonadales bacterium]